MECSRTREGPTNRPPPRAEAFSTAQCSTNNHKTVWAEAYRCMRWAVFVQFILVRRPHCTFRPLYRTNRNRTLVSIEPEQNWTHLFCACKELGPNRTPAVSLLSQLWLIACSLVSAVAGWPQSSRAEAFRVSCSARRGKDLISKTTTMMQTTRRQASIECRVTPVLGETRSRNATQLWAERTRKMYGVHPSRQSKSTYKKLFFGVKWKQQKEHVDNRTTTILMLTWTSDNYRAFL